MEMDINPDWVDFNSYDVGPDNVAHGNGLYGAAGTDRYLHPNGRDFIAMSCAARWSPARPPSWASHRSTPT